MSNFKEAKAKARRRTITEAERKAVKKGQILQGFQCPNKRCMQLLLLAEFRAAPEDHACGRCGTTVEKFTPLFVDDRRITPKDILQHDHKPLC